MTKRPRATDPATASSEEATAFVTALQEKFQRRKRTPKERERLREYLAQYPPDYLRSIARRVLIDIVRGPGRRVGGKPATRSPRKRAKR